MSVVKKIAAIIEKVTGSPELKRLAENFLSLSLLQAANYILPLITLPYLIRVLGAEKYGLVIFAQAFTHYFIILTDYGFDLSATRDISIHRDDKAKVADIFNSVLLIKFSIMSAGFICFLILVFSFQRFSEEWPVFLLSYGVVLGNFLFPLWFFQGMERMKYITVLNILSKSVFTIAVFIFIQAPEDYVYVPLLSSIGYIIAGLWAQKIVIREFSIRYFLPAKSVVFEKLKDSSQFFASRLSLSIFNTSTAFVLGVFTTNEVVGYYSAAERIYTAIRSAYTPLISTLYPYVAKEKNISLFKKAFRIATVFNFCLATMIFFLAFFIVRIMFGDGMEISAYILQIFAVTSIFVVPSALLGYPFLAALGHPGHANNSIILGSLFHLTGLVILAALGMIDIKLVVSLVMMTEILILSLRVWMVKKENLWK